MFLHPPPVFSLTASRALIESQKERERQTWENKREQSWSETREKEGKRFQAGKDKETQTKIASPNRQIEREDVDAGWGWCMCGVLISWVLGVCRLRSIRLSKHRADCDALLWSRVRRADSQLHQYNQRGDLAHFQCWPLPACILHLSSKPLAHGGEVPKPLETGNREDRKKGRNCFFILACCSLPVPDNHQEWGCVHSCVSASWVIHDALCGNAFYVVCFIPLFFHLFCCSFLFLNPLSFLLSHPSSLFQPLLSRPQSLLFFSMTKYSLVVKC